jgi:hypothetical protein
VHVGTGSLGTSRHFTEDGIARVSWKQVNAFRLSRHHLVKRKQASAVASVVGSMAGAQAQLLPAAQMSIWARVSGVNPSALDLALWRDRTLAKAWCMRRTMFLVPSDELALFVRGSALRAEREIRWVLGKGVPGARLEKLVAAVLMALDEPTTQTALAVKVAKSTGYSARYRAGGVGWGNKKKVPWVDFGHLALPANYLLHLAGARGVYCSGPSEGNESTFVRADAWVPRWKDMPQRKAEKELLVRYLAAFGPSTASDFAIWTGMTATDAKVIWSLAEKEMAAVDVEGWTASVLREDLPDLEDARLDEPVVRLLPFFDSFLLGHKSHRNIVGPTEHNQVYRPQGWVSPVLLVDGRAAGVWSHVNKSGKLAVDVRPFARLAPGIKSAVREEAESLGDFLDCPVVQLKLH